MPLQPFLVRKIKFHRAGLFFCVEKFGKEWKNLSPKSYVHLLTFFFCVVGKLKPGVWKQTMRAEVHGKKKSGFLFLDEIKSSRKYPVSHIKNLLLVSFITLGGLLCDDGTNLNPVERERERKGDSFYEGDIPRLTK